MCQVIKKQDFIFAPLVGLPVRKIEGKKGHIFLRNPRSSGAAVSFFCSWFTDTCWLTSPLFSWCQKCVNFSSAAMYFMQSAACPCLCSKCSINYTAASLKKKDLLSPLVGLIGSLQLHHPRRRRKKTPNGYV